MKIVEFFVVLVSRPDAHWKAHALIYAIPYNNLCLRIFLLDQVSLKKQEKRMEHVF